MPRKLKMTRSAVGLPRLFLPRPLQEQEEQTQMNPLAFEPKTKIYSGGPEQDACPMQAGPVNASHPDNEVFMGGLRSCKAGHLIRPQGPAEVC